MSTPNKFWFHHEFDESRVYFASRDGDTYVVTGGNLRGVMHYYADVVEKYIVKDLWVLTIPDHFRVVGNLTGIEYSFLKDANNLYVHRSTNASMPEFHRKEWLMERLYEERLWTPLVYEYDEEFRSKRAERAVEEVFAKEESSDKKPSDKKLISINVNSVRAAAEFDVVNNKHTIKKGLSVEEIEQEILKYVREMYSSLMSGEFEWESRGIGTRSYIVRFQVEDENYGVISVEVDPSVGMPSFYAPVEDFLNQN